MAGEIELTSNYSDLSTEQGWREGIMASCPKCDAPQETNAQFCRHCGIDMKAARHCRQCGAKLRSEAKFCADCGAKTG